eukprot:4155398-Pyramimonas_sp.AAC.1
MRAPQAAKAKALGEEVPEIPDYVPVGSFDIKAESTKPAEAKPTPKPKKEAEPKKASGGSGGSKPQKKQEEAPPESK